MFFVPLLFPFAPINVCALQMELHVFLMRHAPDIVCESVLVPANSTRPPRMPDRDPWIWRPEGGWSGEGVVAFNHQRDLDDIWAKHRDKHRRKPKRALISRLACWYQCTKIRFLSHFITTQQTLHPGRYITNPLLTEEGFKFHVRLHMIVVATPQGKRAAIYNEGEIVLSKKPYVPRHFYDKDLHDTHVKNNKPRNFPADFPGGAPAAADFRRKAITLLDRYFTLAWDEIKWYTDESDGGFELYGCDFMIDTTGRVFLIEINSKPGFLRVKKEQLSILILGGIAEFALQDPGPRPENLRFVTVAAHTALHPILPPP